MKRNLLLFIIFSLSVVDSSMPAAAERQTWKVRPGDNLEMIGTTLEIPKEEIKKQNPGVIESGLQIGQKLKLPLRSYRESKTLEQELRQRDELIRELETKSNYLKEQVASAESQLRWYPVWFWGFWLFFAILTFIASGAYWIFHQTHPRVFDEPHERSIGDLRESQIRARPSSPYDEEGQSSYGGHWQPGH